MSPLLGWDVGGAHVKACLRIDGLVRDIAQWPCPLWQGLQHLDDVLAEARQRWPEGWQPQARHVATMTGEMVDLFPDREEGVARLSARLAEALGPSLMLYAGPRATGEGIDWVAPPDARSRWSAIASANWRATAQLLASHQQQALLVDIGSTTTDLIPLRDGRVCAQGVSDAERLATGELVYHGVVRTPLCALGPRVPIGGHKVNVMSEFFATTADVYRLTGELDPSHDQQPTADGGVKDLAATRQRLARMVGCDARDHADDEWLRLAHFWRGAQLREIGANIERVAANAGLAAHAPLVAAGCGAFLAQDWAARSRRLCLRFADCVPTPYEEHPPAWAHWADVCAPAVAVALLAGKG
ncbi:MAG TPA: hydantoinase/oxoprolinase family protein [Burkholderiaceae bacterium]|nr:hydantoinase/oxoprolinase family protein [Burkholderiaceae bacterium]